MIYRKKENMNLPNRLSMFRIILVILLIIIPYIPGLETEILTIPIMNLIMAVIFIIGGITDIVDGRIARKQELVTDLGKFLDPLADKILVLSASILLVGMNKIPAWIPIIILTREFAVSGYRLIASTKEGKVVAASIWGKLKTITQMIAISFILIDINPIFEFVKGDLNIFFAIFNGIGSVMIIISVFATIFSGWDYMKNIKDLIKD